MKIKLLAVPDEPEGNNVEVTDSSPSNSIHFTMQCDDGSGLEFDLTVSQVQDLKFPVWVQGQGYIDPVSVPSVPVPGADGGHLWLTPRTVKAIKKLCGVS